jgi:transcriptional regulator with XRE-family HTH domain
VTFAENLKRICESRGTNPTALCKKLGLSTSKVSAWYKGSLPKQEMMAGLAKELNCSVQDFFDDGTVTVDNDDEKTLIEGYRNMPKSQQHRLMAYYYALLEGKE